MKTTKETKPLTFEEIKQRSLEQYRILSKHNSFGEPTYSFQV